MIQNKKQYIASLLPLTLTAEGMEHYTYIEAWTFVSAWNLVASSNNLGQLRRLHEAVGQSIRELFKVWNEKGQELPSASQAMSEDAVIKNLHHMLAGWRTSENT